MVALLGFVVFDVDLREGTGGTE